MKNIRLLLALLPALAFSSAHAQPPDPLFHHIPTDADQVYHVNLPALSSKLDWQTLASLTKDRNFGKAKLPFDLMKAMNSGLDFHQDIVIARSNVYHIDSFKYTTILVHLSDSGKFVDFLSSTAKGLHFMHPSGHIRVATGNKTAFAWNDKLAVMVLASAPMYGFGSSQNPPGAHHLAQKAMSALHGATNSIFITDPRITTAFSNDADMQIWSRHAGNMGMMSKMLQGNPAAAKFSGLMQMLSRSSNAPTIGMLRFGPGKISYQVEKFASPQEIASLQHVYGQGLNPEMLSTAPPGRLLGMMAAHTNIRGLVDSMKHLMPMDSLDAMLAKKGMSLQDFFSAFKGDFMVLAYAPDKAATGAAASKPGIFVVCTIGDRDAFTRIAGAMKLSDAATPTQTSPADTTHHGPNMIYSIHNDIAVIGADRGQIVDFFNHPADGANPTQRLLLDGTNAGIFSMGIDMHAIADFLTPLLTKGDTIAAKNQALLDGLRQIDVIVLSSGSVKNDAIDAQFELRMTDKDRNGLSSLLDMIGKLSPKPDGSPQ